VNRALVSGAAFSLVFAATVPSPAQTRSECVATLIQARLAAQKPVRLSAQNVSLTGDMLRLTGHAKVWFDATTVQADEIVINQSSKRVEIKGLRNVYLGGDTSCAPSPPTVRYR
jgi:lipopolysaccharide assembly outer membrane protein LptD (OstA)